ncbi:MAG: hypothetical protein JO197_13055 [Acidobacteria bacterium]|nr:hypothetical protein [Acidobacteriota bacterium]MBV9478202.1 hypothetical protein [Acidobacteriota bacterium]
MRRVLLLLALSSSLLAESRIASDFELAQMEKQLATAHGFEAQLSGHANLGDVRAARNEPSLASREYRTAYDLAARERLDARRDAQLARYATATSYAALAAAKLHRDAEAFAFAEEAVRYASDDAETWNLYASAMRILGYPRKAVSAARNAVTLAKKPLDVAVDQYALATALLDSGESAEAETLLVKLTESLRSERFASLRNDVARQESFEIYSSAHGDVAAYVSLLNRAQLRLARLYEERGRNELARRTYERVLDARSDDATALAGLARLATSSDERERRFAEAFEANPFDRELVAQYRAFLHSSARATPASNGSTGSEVRRAIAQLVRGESRAARETLDALLAKFPANETLRTLRVEAEHANASIAALPSPNPTAAELRALRDGYDALAPEQRVALDAMTFTSLATFESAQVANAQTTLASGTIYGVAFRFSEPTIFAGTFDTSAPLRLTYRILGVTRAGDEDALLLEPVRVEGGR